VRLWPSRVRSKEFWKSIISTSATSC